MTFNIAWSEAVLSIIHSLLDSKVRRVFVDENRAEKAKVLVFLVKSGSHQQGFTQTQIRVHLSLVQHRGVRCKNKNTDEFRSERWRLHSQRADMNQI